MKHAYLIMAHNELPLLNHLIELCFYKGEHWFSITDELADEILMSVFKIKHTFFCAICADELYIQTIAMNSRLSSTIKNNDLRMIDWKRGSPYVFRNKDYEELISSPDLFARKFSTKIDDVIVERLYSRLH